MTRDARGEAPTKVSGEPAPARGAANATLYQARLADPRERAAHPAEAIRGRAPRRAEATSDVTRFRGVLAAAIAGAATIAAAAVLFPPAGGLSAPGPLSRPHARAKLECSSCHKEGEAPAASPSSARAVAPPADPFVAAARKACTGCHGAHASTRPGHRRLAAAGQLGCASCHRIHRGDQGVSFAPGAVPVRFAPGVEVEEPDLAFRPTRPQTVPLVAAASCAGCHDLASASDPIARCLVPGQEALGEARPVVCFDEHQVALPPERAAGGAEPDGPRGGVCAGQHGADRAVAWEAARDAAALAPVLPGSGRGGPLTWLAAAAVASFVAFAAVRGGHALADRRRRRAERPAAVAEAMIKPPARRRLPTIDTATCLGCYACVDACPYDVFEIERYVAVVARPDACCGLTLCEQRCPNGSLVVTDGEPIGDRPRLSASLESLDTPGLFLAGDVTGLPLIKNAILQGAHAVEQIAESLKQGSADDAPLDLIVVGAGPAGISAALRAKELGLRCEVVEQGSVAQSIQSFPRGKLVFDQPLELPITGKLWLEQSTKEELLVQWLRIVRQERLEIRQDTRMTAVRRQGRGFVVTTEPREGGAPTERSSRRVLVAIGQRGTPRRLAAPIPPEAEARVHYHLADARSFAGKRVAVVGLGDVAMETAIALGRQPDTRVTLIHRGADFSRGKVRNIQEVRRMRDAGRLELLFDAEVAQIEADEIEVRTARGGRRLRYDALMVMIGSIPPWSTLRAAGVHAAETGAPDPAPPPVGDRTEEPRVEEGQPPEPV